jgi:ERCC4-related helicase
MVEDFTPSDEEYRLYEMVSEYLQRPEVAAIRHSQRALMVLIYRKILASSSFAIAQTLESLIGNLDRQIKGLQPESVESLIKDVDGYEEELEEIAKKEDGEAIENDTEPSEGKEADFTSEEIEAEKQELIGFKNLAERINKNSKGEALIIALRKAFEHNKKMGWPEKAVIFTESRRTQQYIFHLLLDADYKDRITLFSGTNEGPISRRAYERWIKERVRHDKELRLSKEASIREALIHEFRHYTNILIATEAGAEGINLQFCNIVVNYDLPWNPQRIEQRIGRCHRYGQKHDVVVLNFLNRKNAADNRVFELLDKKLRLFDGVFGVSDEVFGVIGSGVDFEKRILDIYQSCRTAEEINKAFDALQSELAEQIKETMLHARSKLLENFDDEVRARLRTRDEGVYA